MKKIKVKESELVYNEIKKRYLIDYKGREVEIEKWLKSDLEFMDYDDGWEFTNEKNKQYFETLGDEEQDAFNDFVQELDLYADDIRG